MLAQEYIQVSFHLTVRKGDLSVLSMKECDMVYRDMAMILNLIIEKGYLVTVQMMLDGVMTSIKG